MRFGAFANKNGVLADIARYQIEDRLQTVEGVAQAALAENTSVENPLGEAPVVVPEPLAGRIVTWERLRADPASVLAGVEGGVAAGRAGRQPVVSDRCQTNGSPTST